MGAKIQNRTIKPQMIFNVAQNGTTNGDPIYAIWDQSNVSGKSPSPDDTPNYGSQFKNGEDESESLLYLPTTRYQEQSK